MEPLRSPDPEEREALLAVLPRGLPDDGGVASVFATLGGRVIDGGVRLDGSRAMFVRPLPPCDPASLASWLRLIERRGGQLAHDASGPATGVLAALETVLEYEPIPESSRALLMEAREGVLRIARTLDARPLLSPDVVSGPLRAIVGQVSATLVSSLDPGAERLRVEVRASTSEVRIDAGALHAALGAVLTNALKFRRGTRAQVVIEAAVDRERVCIDVLDDGRAMDDATLCRAGQLGFTTRAGGLGLGLFMLRWMLLSPRHGVLVLGREGNSTRTSLGWTETG